MAGPDVGQGTRLAAATGAFICFEDEAGQNLRPPKARTWAPRGRTPNVRVSGKGSGRVSVAGLVCLKAEARGRLFYRVRVHRGRKGEHRSMSEADYAGLITAAHQQLHAPVILIWDNLNTHISAVMRTFAGAHPDWLTVIQLPSYAPDLNPAEGVWANMKNGLGNLATPTVSDLAAIVKNRLKRIQYRPELSVSRALAGVSARSTSNPSMASSRHSRNHAPACPRWPPPQPRPRRSPASRRGPAAYGPG